MKIQRLELRIWPEKVRVEFQDARGRWWKAVPFQDLAVKLHRLDCPTCASSQFGRLVQHWFGRAQYLRVGLAREFRRAQDDAPLCWLQVNAVLAASRGHFLSLP